MAAKKRPVFHLKRCIACAACTEDCPVSCLSLAIPGGKGRHAKPFLSGPEACTGCGICSRTCPVGAVSMAETPVG